MTPPTGKRISRACMRCRRRKTKCNLDGIGEPKRPPCESCHLSKTECVLAVSRRGATGRLGRRQEDQTPKDTGSTTSAQAENSTLDVEGGPTPTISGKGTTTCSNHHDPSTGKEFVHQEDHNEEDLHMELRNPSDALQILAHARDSSQPQGSTQENWSTTEEGPTHMGTSRMGPSPGGRSVGPQQEEASQSQTSMLDDYELVQRGLVHPTVVPELLHIFARHYHPYCPLTPSYILDSQAMTKIQRADYFLVTVILAVASRDSPGHTLTHRYCWDHAQRLLLEVLLAHSWAQNPRTVQALLLLAEWLPYQVNQGGPESTKSLLSVDQSAWSLVGLAVRQGYLLRLDRTAFRVTNQRPTESKAEEEEKRLIWAFIYLADRQISVRMGQSFWSRGPALSTTFTAQDFPNLKPLPGTSTEDYAAVLQANLELTQILYNAHGILYSSTERTLALVYDGSYARYLDDFQRAANSWHATWTDVQASPNIKSTLSLLHNYICLYVNAFSFQAVLTRASKPDVRSSSCCDRRTMPQDALPLASLFSAGLMTSPDGPYVYEAISSARNILKSFDSINPRETLRYMPTRYYLYGVYAAVFLHKAQSTGAFQSVSQRQENTGLAGSFISNLEQTSSDEAHLCRRYSAMLRRIWQRHNQGQDQGQSQSQNYGQSLASAMPSEALRGNPEDVSTTSPATVSRMPWVNGNSHCPMSNYNETQAWEPQDAVSNADVFDLFGSFFPGVTEDGSHPGFEGGFPFY